MRRSLHQSQKKKVISFSQPILLEEEERALIQTIRSGRLVMGPNVEKFEEMIASFCGQKHAIAVTSGTSALTLSLSAMEVDRNSFVVVPAYTWVATYNAPKLLGATVRLADIDPNTFCFNSISTKQILSQASEDQKTVVIPVHMFGNRCPSDLGQYDLVLGDGCCSFGGLDVDGRRCGNWNEIECFSFHPRKLITTGEGGMILCSDDNFANKLRIQRDHGAYRSKEQRHQTVHGGDMIPEFPEVGYNLRLTDLQGALGVTQMQRIEMIIDSRRKVAERYDIGLQEISSPDQTPDVYLKLPSPDVSGGERVLTMYSIQLRSKKLDEFLSYLLPSASLTPSTFTSSGSLTKEFLEVTLQEIYRLRQMKSQLMSLLVTDGVTARPPMISLLDVSHIQQDHLTLTGENLLDDLIKLKSFPGTFVTSQLTFALPLHPLLTSDEVDHVISRLYYHFTNAMSHSTSFIPKSLEISSSLPHDFTIQYPIRREYFKSYFLIPKNKTNLSHTTKSNITTTSDTTGNRTQCTIASYDSLCNTSFLPPPVELISNKDLLLYLHIPFCKSKCHYCNFAVDTRQSFELRERYSKNLAEQVQQWSSVILDPKYNITLSGIDIGKSPPSLSLSPIHLLGGGTPTLLSENHLEIIMSSLQPLLKHQQKKNHDSSFLSIETTPEIAATEPSKLKLLFQSGIHRISVGIQTSNETLLCQVNRSTTDHVDLAVSNLRQIGYHRINLDLIFGLPNQSLEQWKADLRRVVQLNPDSITTYDCVYKGKGRGINSIMSKQRDEQNSLPSWSLYGEMYDYGYQYLHSQGYRAPYGSVNFSRIPNETGTSRYFENRLLRGMNYVGLGNYSSTMIDRYWIFSPYTVEGWLADTSLSSTVSKSTSGGVEESSGSLGVPQWLPYNAYSLPIEERVSKYILSSLSFGFLDERYFSEIFPTWTLENFYSREIFEELVEKKKWLRYEEKEGRFYLNDHCFQYMPQIRAMFHSKRSLRWFEEHVMNWKEDVKNKKK